MAKLVITIEEKAMPAEDGRSLIGFATDRKIEAEDGERTALIQMAPIFDVAVSMIIRSFFAQFGTEPCGELHSPTPLQSLESVMAQEIAKHSKSH